MIRVRVLNNRRGKKTMQSLTREVYKKTMMEAVLNASSYGDLETHIKQYAQWVLKNNVPGEFSKALMLATTAYMAGSVVPHAAISRDILVYMCIHRENTLGRTLESLKLCEDMTRDVEFMMRAIVCTKTPYNRINTINDEKTVVVDVTTEKEEEVYIQKPRLINIPTFRISLMNRDEHRTASPLKPKLIRRVNEKNKIKKEIKLDARGQAANVPVIDTLLTIINDLFVVSPNLATMGLHVKIEYGRQISAATTSTCNDLMWKTEKRLPVLIHQMSLLRLKLDKLHKHESKDDTDTVSGWLELQTIVEKMTDLTNTALKGIFQYDICIDDIIIDYQDLCEYIVATIGNAEFPDMLAKILSGFHYSKYSSHLKDIASDTLDELDSGMVRMCNYISINKTAEDAGISNVDERVILSGAYHSNILKSIHKLINSKESPGANVWSGITIYTLDATYFVLPSSMNSRVQDDSKHTYNIKRV